MSWRGVGIDNAWTALAGERAREAARLEAVIERQQREARIMAEIHKLPAIYPAPPRVTTTTITVDIPPLPPIASAPGDHEDRRCAVCNQRCGKQICRGCQWDMADDARALW